MKMISRVFFLKLDKKSQENSRWHDIETPVKLKQEKLEYLANLEKEKETNAKITQEVGF